MSTPVCGLVCMVISDKRRQGEGWCKVLSNLTTRSWDVERIGNDSLHILYNLSEALQRRTVLVCSQA